MSKYKFYSKSDPNKEAITIIEAPDLDAAVTTCSTIKNLTIDDFLKLFKVEEV